MKNNTDDRRRFSSDFLKTEGIVGDGKHDDAKGLQSALDTQDKMVYLPPPPVQYTIRSPLRIHSNQTLLLDRHTIVRLGDHADNLMLTNADHLRGNENIAVIGGIWDMNNLNQSPHPDTSPRQGSYDPERYIGVLMRFNKVKNLCLRSMTIKDPESLGVQLGNLNQFTIEDITFDYNLKRLNMDGIHVHGNSRWGRIANLKGTTNDDLVALTADDAGVYEMCRGPIEDILVDGIFMENGWNAVRLLSHGSPVRRIKLANIYGTTRYHVFSLTNHKVHPGEDSTFEDISVEGVFCSKSTWGMSADPFPKEYLAYLMMPLVKIEASTVVSNLTIRDYHRTEGLLAADDIIIEAGATVEHLGLSDVTLHNRCGSPFNLLHNCGTIGNLALMNVYAKADGAGAGGYIVRNEGAISQFHPAAVTGMGFELGM